MHSRSSRLFGLVFAVSLLFLPIADAATAQRVRAAEADAAPTPELAWPDGAATTLALIENQGQFADEVRYQARTRQGILWLTDDALWLSVPEPASPTALLDTMPADAGSEPRRGVNLRLSFVGANPEPQLEPLGRSETIYSYYRGMVAVGNAPLGWFPDVPAWSGVRYLELYPGVDLLVSGDARGWSWSLVATDDAADPAAALAAVRLRVEGADALRLAPGGLQVETAVRALTLPLLQVLDDGLQPLVLSSSEPQLVDGVVLAPYAPPATVAGGATILAEPGELVYGTYLGGLDIETPHAIAVDSAGQAYVTGAVWSPSFPATPGAYDTAHEDGFDVFVSLLDADGSSLIYNAILGGDGDDHGLGIAVDEAGRAYLVGYTDSADYPTTAGAFDESHSGLLDAFVTVLNPLGTELVYSTFLGGSYSDYGYGIALDQAGRAYVAGLTRSANYPTTDGAYQTSLAGPDGVSDAFVAVLNDAGTDLVYSTYLGGTLEDHARGIAVDPAGRAYVTGETTSPDFPTTSGAYQRTHGGETDAFVAVLTAAGSGLVYSTLLGGDDVDQPNAIAVDGLGRAHVTGATLSGGAGAFPTTPGAYNNTHHGGQDLFVLALAADGSALHFGVLLGGDADDVGQDIAVDEAGRVYVTGRSAAAATVSFPTRPGAYQADHNGSVDAVLAILNSDGSELVYSSFLGGSDLDYGTAIALGGSGWVHVTGQTASTDFPTTPGAYDLLYSDSWDAFAVALDARPADLAVTKLVDWGGMAPDASQVFTLTLTGPSHPGGDAKTVGYQGGIVTWPDLAPGTYALSEEDPGIAWHVSLSDSEVTISGGVDAAATITNTFQAGNLVVTKVVDWSGITPDAGQLFTLTLTGPSHPAGDARTVGYQGGAVTWSHLAAGTYTLSEVGPGVAWAVAVSGAQVAIADGITSTATITNTYRPGDLAVTKLVDWSGIPPQVGQRFTLTITGPSYPSGDSRTVGSTGGSATWSHLEPGVYTVDEADVGVAWEAAGRGAQVTVSGGISATATISNTYQPGSLAVTKVVDWSGASPDAAQVFTITIAGPSHPGGDTKTIGYLGGPVTWTGLAPGAYTVTELDPPQGWHVGGDGAQVAVSGGVTSTVTLTNTFRHYLYLPLIER